MYNCECKIPEDVLNNLCGLCLLPVPLQKAEIISDDEVQNLLKWIEKCTLTELILAKEYVENYRGKNQ